MRLTAISCSFVLAASLTGTLRADDQNKQLYADLVAPVLSAKCVSCHGEDKQKGKLRVDTVAFIMEGEAVVAGKPDESTLLERVYLPLDDDDHMPPEDKDQLTKQETALLAFWVKAGAKEKGTVAEAKPDKDAAAAIAHVAANIPKASAVAKADAPKIDPAKEKLILETIGRIEDSGASLMAIAQNTPELRYSALNITKDFKDDNLAALKPIADQVKWMDLARTGVTDKGLANLTGMKNLTRLHLENTAVTDAGLDSLKGLANLEYLNLYGTKVTDAGVAKLAGLTKLKKVFVWQSKVTDAGAKKLAAAIPGIEVNTGWKASAVEPVLLAAATPKPAAKPAPATPAPKPAAKPAPKPTTPTPAAKPAPKTPAPKPAAKPAPATPAPKPAPKPAPTTPAPKPAAKPAPTAPAPANATFAKALAELKATSDKTSKEAAASKAAFDAAIKTVADATKKAEALKAKSENAAKVAAETKAALTQLEKAAAAKK